MIRIWLLLWLVLPHSLTAQVDLPTDFSDRLAAMDVVFAQPADTDFRSVRGPENDYLNDDLVLTSRREKLEMRATLLPENETDVYYGRPQMRCMTTVMNLQSNDANAVTAVHGFDRDELDSYGADWGRMYTFRPKLSYSDKQTAQFLVLYKEGRGLIYHLLLFDRPPAQLEARQYLFSFR